MLTVRRAHQAFAVRHGSRGQLLETHRHFAGLGQGCLTAVQSLIGNPPGCGLFAGKTLPEQEQFGSASVAEQTRQDQAGAVLGAQTEIDERHLQLSGHEIIDKAAAKTGSTVSAQLKENVSTTDTTLTAKTSSFLLSKVAETEVVKNMAVNYIEKKLGETVMMDENMTNDVLNVKIESILEDGVLNTIIEKYIKSTFGGLKMNVILIFFVGLAIPLAEIILAHYLERKRVKTAIEIAPTVAPTQSACDNKDIN